MIELAIASGVGTPVAYGLIKGMQAKAKKATVRDYAVVGLAAFAVTAVANYLLQPTTPPATVVRKSAGYPSMSVSDVTVQLGRYAGGIDYPGQLTGGTQTNGDLVYID